MTIRSSRRILRCTAAWLALAGTVLNTVWPLLANAKPAVPSSPSEICSASSLNHAAGGAPAAPGKSPRASHCWLCPFGAHCVTAIPHTAQTPLASVPAALSVFSRGDAPRAGIALHAAAPPRAPPFLS